MKHFIIPVAALLLLTLSSCFSLQFDDLKEEELISYDIDVKDFHSIEAGDQVRLYVSSGAEITVRAEIPPQDDDMWKFKVRSKTLEIRSVNHPFVQPEPINVYIQLPRLEGLNLSGAASCLLNDLWSVNSINLNLSGNAGLGGKGGFIASEGQLSLSGTSRISLFGQIEELNLSGSGACSFDLKDCLVRDLAADLSGTSSGYVFVIDTLSCSLSGSSELRYTGTPDQTHINTSGVSRVLSK